MKRRIQPTCRLIFGSASLIIAAFLTVMISPHVAYAADAGEPEGIIRQALADRNPATRHLAIRALRELNASSLEPFWQALTTHEDITVAIQGELGLAGLRNPAGVTPEQLADLEDPARRQALLTAALDQDLLTTDALTQLVAWEGLDPATRALLVLKRGEPVQAQPWMQTLLESPKLGRQGMGALLITLAGDPRGLPALQQLGQSDTLDPPPPASQIAVVQVMLLRTALAGAASCRLVPRRAMGRPTRRHR